jgi:hypothetical protein
MKGFKDSNNKFHPITQSKGVRKSRDQSAKITGVKIERKARVPEKSIEKMFEFKTVVTDKDKDFEFDRFASSITDFGSGDIATAVEKFQEVGLSGSELADAVREFSDDTGTDLNDVDVVFVAYDHILQNARNEISSVLDFDIVNDIEGGTEFYVAGNFMATSYDYSQEAVDQLRDVLKKASKSDLQMLSENIFVKSFLSDVDVF